jgi:hypothetical protein
VLALAAAAAGCEGVTIEIVQPALGGGAVGAPGITGWELRVDPIAEAAACPRPSEHRFDAPPIRVPAGATAAGLEGLALAPGRYVASVIGRAPDCAARYFGRTCFGPEPPPRVVAITTCEVAAGGCVDFGWTVEDRVALECRSPCGGAGSCE